MKLAILLLTVQVLVLSMAKPNSFSWAQTTAIVSDCQDRCKGKPEHKQCLEECNESPCGPASNWDAVCGFKHATCWVSQNKKVCSCKCGGTRDNCFRCKGEGSRSTDYVQEADYYPSLEGEGSSSGTGNDYATIWDALDAGLNAMAAQCSRVRDVAACNREINEKRNQLKNSKSIREFLVAKGFDFEEFLRSTRRQEADYYPSLEGEGSSSGTGQDYGSEETIWKAALTGLRGLLLACRQAGRDCSNENIYAINRVRLGIHKIRNAATRQQVTREFNELLRIH